MKSEVKIKFGAIFIVLSSMFLCNIVYAGPHYASGQVVSLLASGSSPAIRLTGNVSPENCDGGNFGWLYFQGSAEVQQRVYATALALSLSGIAVTVYTNSDGGTCKIESIQATSIP